MNFENKNINTNYKNFEIEVTNINIKNENLKNVDDTNLGAGMLAGTGVALGAGIATFGPGAAMAIATTFITNITNTDYYERYIKTILNYALKQKTQYKKLYPGLIILEIDGLSINTLKKAIGKGMMPNIKKFLDETHTLKEWETDLSSQTGASQAGILHGNNDNIVSYRWVEKENNNKIIVSGKLSDAPMIEKRISNGKGLLVNGISIANMFSGDSKIPTLTSSKLNGLANIYNKTLNAAFLDAYNFQRLFVLFLWDILVELKSQFVHGIKNIQPRLRR